MSCGACGQASCDGRCSPLHAHAASALRAAERRHRLAPGDTLPDYDDGDDDENDEVDDLDGDDLTVTAG